MKNKTTLLLWLFLFFIPGSLLAQNRTIKGKVSDETGAPISAANVTVKGAKQGTQTNADGNFSLSVPGTGKVTLIISHTSYKTIEFSADETVAANVQLEKE